MSVADQDYELKLLKIRVGKYLDESVSNTEEGLKALEHGYDEVVWDVATKIYQQSGHKIELSIIRDIVKSKIEALQDLLDAEQNEIAEKLAEETRRFAEKKVQFCAELKTIPRELVRNERKSLVFVIVRKVISELLSVEEDEVLLDSHLNHLNRNESDLIELVMELEEEFDIEILDDEIESELDIHQKRATPKRNRQPDNSFSGGLSIPQFISPNLYIMSYIMSGGENCTVRRFVDLIHRKA